MDFAAHHMINTGSAFFDRLILSIYEIFLAPGEAMLHGLSSMPWGHRLVSQHDMFPLTFILAMFFWLVVFVILGAMDEMIRNTIFRRERKSSPLPPSYPTHIRRDIIS